MGLDVSINPPLVNELKALGLLDGTADTSKVGVPGRLKVEGFTGKASGTQALAETPVAVVAVLAIPTAAGNILTKVVTTNYTISGSTLTYVTNESANEWIIIYYY